MLEMRVRLNSTADESQSSVLYVENVHAMADALDLVDYLESRGPGNKLLACKLWEKKQMQVPSGSPRKHQ